MPKQSLSKFTAQFGKKAKKEGKRVRLQRLLGIEPTSGIHLHSLEAMLNSRKKDVLLRHGINKTWLSNFDNAVFKLVKELENKKESKEYIHKFLVDKLAPEKHLK